MSFRTTASAAAAFLTLAALPAVAAEPAAVAGTPAQEAVRPACLAEAQTLSVFTTNKQTVVELNGQHFIEPEYNLGTAMFGGLGGMVNGKARQEYVGTCMEGRAPSPAPKTERPAALLPQAAVEPFTVGAIRIDPASLKPAPGVISGVNRLLVGTANYRSLAVVRADTTVRGEVLRAGTVLREFVHDGDEGDNASYWCLASDKPRFGGEFACLWQDQTGFTAYENGSTTPSLYPVFARVFDSKKSPQAALALEPTPAKAEDAMTFDIAVVRVGEGGVAVAAEVTRRGETVVFWRSQLLFDEHGRAVLPFWTHRLVLTREGSGVTAAFTPDGDGKAWSAADMGPVW